MIDIEKIYANLDQAFLELESNTIWRERVMMSLRISEVSFKIAFGEFKAACMVAAEDHTAGTLMRYFSHWYPRNKDRLPKVNVANTPNRID